MKEDLLPNDIKYPIFINYYIKLSLEKIELCNQNQDKEEKLEISIEKQKLASQFLLDKIYQKFQIEEQIDNKKIHLFFIMKLKSNYNHEYLLIISKKYIKTKRLVIQNYNIINNIMNFKQKKYCFISIVNKNEEIFNYNNKQIKIIKKKG